MNLETNFVFVPIGNLKNETKEKEEKKKKKLCGPTQRGLKIVLKAQRVILLISLILYYTLILKTC